MPDKPHPDPHAEPEVARSVGLEAPAKAPADVLAAIVPAKAARPPGTQGAPARESAAPAGVAGASPEVLHDEQPVHPGVPLSPPGIVPESDVRTHSPAAAAPHKPAQDEGLGDLPLGYGDGRLVCLVRDPRTLYVYWDLGQQQLDQSFAGLGPARAVLRLWNGRGAELVREAEVHLEARGWYVRELPGAIELRVELWAVGENGQRLIRAARPLKLPPSLPSDVLEEFYAFLPLEQPLPRDGVPMRRPLTWVSGSAPAGWERRLQPRMAGANRSSSRLPWSATHLRDLDDEDDR